MHNQFKNIPAAAVDIENDLRNQTRILSRSLVQDLTLARS